MNKYKRLGKNSLLVFVGSIGSKLLAILMLPFYTAWLSVESYGDVDLVSTYVSLIMGIVTLCVTDAIFRFPQGKSREEQRMFFSSGLVVVSLSLVSFGVLKKCRSDVCICDVRSHSDVCHSPLFVIVGSQMGGRRLSDLPINRFFRFNFLYALFHTNRSLFVLFLGLRICDERDVILFNPHDTECHALVDIRHIQSVVPRVLPFDRLGRDLRRFQSFSLDYNHGVQYLFPFVADFRTGRV